MASYNDVYYQLGMMGHERDAVYRRAKNLANMGVDPDVLMEAITSGNSDAELKRLERRYSF